MMISCMYMVRLWSLAPLATIFQLYRIYIYSEYPLLMMMLRTNMISLYIMIIYLYELCPCYLHSEDVKDWR